MLIFKILLEILRSIWYSYIKCSGVTVLIYSLTSNAFGRFCTLNYDGKVLFKISLFLINFDQILTICN